MYRNIESRFHWLCRYGGILFPGTFQDTKIDFAQTVVRAKNMMGCIATYVPESCLCIHSCKTPLLTPHLEPLDFASISFPSHSCSSSQNEIPEVVLLSFGPVSRLMLRSEVN